MLDIPAKTVFVDPRARELDNCRARLDRMLPHVRCDDVREYDEAAREAWRNVGHRRHGKDDFGDDALVFFTDWEPGRTGWYHHWRDESAKHDGACQAAVELNIVAGCVFRCAYCGFGRGIHFTLDVERYVDELDAVFAAHPGQRLYKYSNMTDLPPFEPEYDAVPPMVRRFAAEPDRYLMLFTKSDNVEFLLDLEHGGHTIISWSLTCETAGRELDKRTPGLDERIDAMQRCQAAGYLVRARLSPIVPVRHWRREYRRLFEDLFAKVRPDVVTLELLGWFDFEDLPRLLDLDLLDREMVADAWAAADELRGVGWGPFTEAAHQQVYRFCIETSHRLAPDVPVAVCHGSPQTWQALGGLMGMAPESYVCNCGPLSAPGGALYDRLHPSAG
ncbi:MAG: radical SAM protein [Planctomycetota bacterium]